jgi:hypothetical protein
MCHPIWLCSRKYGTVWYHPASSKLWYLTTLSFVNFQGNLTGTSHDSLHVWSQLVRLAVCLALGVHLASTHGFSDADFAICRVERKSTSGSCQFLGSSLVSWSSRKQSSLAQSTTEAEYVAAASCCSQLLWISYTLRDFGEECTHIPLLCDSTSAISVAKNPVLHSRTKHIEVRYHFLRDNVEKGTIVLSHVPTQD